MLSAEDAAPSRRTLLYVECPSVGSRSASSVSSRRARSRRRSRSVASSVALGVEPRVLSLRQSISRRAWRWGLCTWHAVCYTRARAWYLLHACAGMVFATRVRGHVVYMSGIKINIPNPLARVQIKTYTCKVGNKQKVWPAYVTPKTGKLQCKPKTPPKPPATKPPRLPPLPLRPLPLPLPPLPLRPLLRQWRNGATPTVQSASLATQLAPLAKLAPLTRQSRAAHGTPPYRPCRPVPRWASVTTLPPPIGCIGPLHRGTLWLGKPQGAGHHLPRLVY